MSPSLADIVLSTSWPSRRNRMRFDADWLLYITDKWRSTLCGIPSVFL